MTDEKAAELPAVWWVRLRLAAIFITLWMASGYFTLQHSLAQTSKMTTARTAQAAQLAGVALSPDEQRYFGKGSDVPDAVGGDRADQIVAIGSLAALESDRASDSVDGMIATITAGVGSLVVFISGGRDWLKLREARRKKKPHPRPAVQIAAV